MKKDKKGTIVSVIVPCYNSEKYIEKVLTSLENQTFKEFEVIIINDGSEDNTEKIIKEYIKKSKLDVNYIVQKNSGVSKSRNVGIKKAKGSYIVFLDSDDMYDEEYIEILYKYVSKNEVDTVCCCYTRGHNKLNVKKEIETVEMNHMKLMKQFMYRSGPCGFTTYIYSKNILEKNNIYFKENLKYGEDTNFTWKYLSHCENGIFVNQNLYWYQNNLESAVNNISWSIVDTIKSVSDVENYLEEKKDAFRKDFNKYMKSRSKWAVAKEFAKRGEKELYNEFVKRYEVKYGMKMLIKESTDIRIKISSLLYCIHNKIFYYMMRMM